MELVLPTIEYGESFLEAVKELEQANPSKQYIEESTISRVRSCGSIEKYLKHLEERRLGNNLPPNFVPSTVYWLVDGEKFIGATNIRHELTDHLREIGGHIGYWIRPSERRKGYGTKILELALKKAKELDIQNVRITCDVGNTASAKVIEKNGGILEDVAQTDEGAKKRYWIKNQ